MPCLTIWAEPRLRFGRRGWPNQEGRRRIVWAWPSPGNRSWPVRCSVWFGAVSADPYGGSVEVCLPCRIARWLVWASAEPLGRFGATLSCRCPRMALGWSEAGADLRPDPSDLGEDPPHYELPSLTRRVSRIVLRVPTRRKLLGGRALFEGIPEGTKRQR